MHNREWEGRRPYDDGDFLDRDDDRQRMTLDDGRFEQRYRPSASFGEERSFGESALGEGGLVEGRRRRGPVQHFERNQSSDARQFLEGRRHERLGHGIGREWELGPSYGHGDFGPSEARTPRKYPKGPKGYKRSDERIKEDVCESLYQADDLDSSEIEVSVINGEVILAGTVPNRWMKFLAEHLCERVGAVTDVKNNMRVRSYENQQQTSGQQGQASQRGYPSQGSSPSGQELGSEGNGKKGARS